VWARVAGLFVEQDQVRLPGRLGRFRSVFVAGRVRCRWATDSFVSAPGGRRAILARDSGRYTRAFEPSAFDFLEYLFVSGTKPDEGKLLTAPIRMRVPRQGPEGLFDLIASAAPLNSEGVIRIHGAIDCPSIDYHVVDREWQELSDCLSCPSC
jgi:hypothetical protein